MVIESDASGLWRRKMFGLLDEGGMLVALFDPDDVLRYANPAFRDEFGVPAEAEPTWLELMVQAARLGKGTRIQTDDVEAWLHAALSRRGKLRERSFETDMCSGRWLWATERLDRDGWMLFVAQDVTAIAHDGEQRMIRIDRDIALRIARTDELTGTLNRRGILALLEDVACRLPEEGRRYAVCLVDIDHFKWINDGHGHDAGDQVLRDFVAHALASVRHSDAVGRHGGEEFLLLFPDVDAAGAAAIVDRMRATLPAVCLSDADVALSYSFSAGVLGVQGRHPVRELLLRVDRALYAAKENGRARTVTDTLA